MLFSAPSTSPETVSRLMHHPHVFKPSATSFELLGIGIFLDDVLPIMHFLTTDSANAPIKFMTFFPDCSALVTRTSVPIVLVTAAPQHQSALSACAAVPIVFRCRSFSFLVTDTAYAFVPVVFFISRLAANCARATVPVVVIISFCTADLTGAAVVPFVKTKIAS